VSAYRVEFHAKGDAETIGLPAEAYVALYETLVAVSREPWVRSESDALMGDSSFRWAPFGKGLGVVHFKIDEDDHVLRIHGVTWTG
jgi:hypothetical protein